MKYINHKAEVIFDHFWMTWFLTKIAELYVFGNMDDQKQDILRPIEALGNLQMFPPEMNLALRS